MIKAMGQNRGRKISLRPAATPREKLRHKILTSVNKTGIKVEETEKTT
jgi:hypothetical protein